MWRINSAGSSKAPEAAHSKAAVAFSINCRLRAGGVVLCCASDFGFVASLGNFSA